MNRYKKTFKTWNTVAKLYEDKFMDLTLYNSSYDLFCQLLNSKTPKLLDIGCGPGNITKYLLSKLPESIIEGVDIAPNMITLAKQNNPKAQFYEMDIRSIDTLTSKYNGIICGFGLPYLSKTDCETLINSSYNLLKPKGILYLSFVEGNYDNSGYISGNSGDQVFFYYHNLKLLKQLLIAQQFNSITITYVDYPKSETITEKHTIIMARK